MSQNEKGLKVSGDRAIRSGLRQEAEIENFLKTIAKYNITYRRIKPRALADICGKDVYGDNIWYDFIVFGMAGYKDGFYIESKTQSIQGTVDRQFPYMFENILHFANKPVLVVLNLVAKKNSAVGVQKRFNAIKNWANTLLAEHKEIGGTKLMEVVTFKEMELWILGKVLP